MKTFSEKHTLKISLIVLGLISLTSCSNGDKHTIHLSAGEATIRSTHSSAFSKHSANIKDTKKILRFNLGNDFFERAWVSRRASTKSRDGLGPHFNNNACQNCHIKDGRGHAPNVSSTENGTDFSSLLIRASRSNISNQQQQDMLSGKLSNVPDNAVGGQLQHRSNLGIQSEVSQRVSYETVTITLSDKSEIHLRKPIWHLISNYADRGHNFNSDTVFSARIAPPMIGLGLLAEISESDILNSQDIHDANKDGISGKANYVWDIESASVKIGRFGWKAGQPSLRQQAAGAFLNDMGLTSKLLQSENCQAHQTDCINSQNGNGDQSNQYPYEVPDKILSDIVFYSRNLAVPQRRNAYDSDVKKGRVIFDNIGCASCHTPSFRTQRSSINKEQSKQKIYPYTDLLLHDMGKELADFTINNQPVSSDILNEFKANAHEWRTPPLWGLGLTKIINPQASFLHDGRARTILEAILWHGGEAEKSKQAVISLSTEDRSLLLRFLKDL